MPSLQKLYIKEHINETDKILKWIYDNVQKYLIISTKLDGVSILLHVTQQIQLYTRGDGFNGRNISNYSKYLNINNYDLFKLREILG